MIPFDQAWVLLKDDNWYDHYPNQPMSMTNSQLEGENMAFIESFIDHPNWESFKEAKYPWDRVVEFFGLEGKQLHDVNNEMNVEWDFRQDEDTRPRVDDTDIDFAPEVFMEHERHNIVNRPDGGHSHEMLPTFGNVNINEPAPIDGVRVGRDMQNIALHDGEEDVFSPWNERYKGERISPHSRTPFSEQDQMKYASEPFDQAWRMLKSDFALWPKSLNNYTNDKGTQYRVPGHFRKPGPEGVTRYFTDNTTDSFAILPNTMEQNRAPDGSIPEHISDERVGHNVMQTLGHEDTHEAMNSIGEFYGRDDGGGAAFEDEYPAYITQMLMMARQPRDVWHPRDKMLEQLDRGVDPMELAMQTARSHSESHPHVSGTGTGSDLPLVTHKDKDGNYRRVI
jgi:hypothetical protein